MPSRLPSRPRSFAPAQGKMAVRPPPFRPSLARPAGKVAANPQKPWPPRGRGPGRPVAVPVSGLPYPLFERTVDDGPSERVADVVGSGRDDDLAWSSPEALADARPSRSGVFVIERLSGKRWAPVYVGMSAIGVGHALRWIVQAAAIFGVNADWNTLRVRVGEAGFDTANPAGRATLRRLRDETAAAIEISDGRRVLVGPGPAAVPLVGASTFSAPAKNTSRGRPATQQRRA
jgi:hypothetical protein